MVLEAQRDCCYRGLVLELSLQFGHFFPQFLILLLNSFGLCTKVQRLTEEDRRFRVA